MRVRISIVALAVLGLSPVHAADDQVKREPVPAWVTPSALMAVPDDAGGLMFVRRQDVQVHLDQHGQAEYLGYRMKILHANALQMGNLSIAWRPEAGAPAVHGIKIYRGGEMIDVLKTSTFEILRREDQLEAARLDGMLTAVLRVADLRVGDELEVEMTTRSNDPTLGSDVAGVMLLAPEPLPGRFSLVLSWEEGQQPRSRFTPDIAAVVKQSKQAIEARFDNPPVATPPADAPVRYAWRRLIEYSDFADWAAISRRFAPIYAEAATLAANSPLRQEVSRIAAAHASPMDRARAALKLVQQDVRYIYVGLGNGNLIPASADETWQRRYGDCKGKTALLLALLAGLNIQAEAVLANNSGFDDGLDERLPNPGAFDHVLVRARIGGRTYWLDGTMPPVVTPAAEPVLPYRWVLPLAAKGAAIEHLAWRPEAVPDEINLFEIDARQGFDKPAKITNQTIIRGMKGLEQQVSFSGLTRDQMLPAFRQKAIGATWQEIDDVQWRYDERARASILTVVGSGKVDWEETGGQKSLALPGGGFSPPTRRARGAGPDRDLPYFSAPDFNCYVTTVRLPTTTYSRQWSFKDGFDTRLFGRNYYRAFALRDGAIRMIRGSRVEQTEIDAASADKDNGRITAFDNSMGWIFYDPEGQAGPHASSLHVPATYDIDWSADEVPCLSPETLSVAEPPTGWSLYNRGIAHDNRDEYQAARADFSAAIRASPNNADAYMARGVIFFDDADFESAVADFTRAHQLKPRDAIPLVARGGIYATQKKQELARRDFEAARQIDPANPWVLRWDATIATKAGDRRDAIAKLTRVLDDNPGELWALATRAENYRMLGDDDKARADEARVAELKREAKGDETGDAAGTP